MRPPPLSPEPLLLTVPCAPLLAVFEARGHFADDLPLRLKGYIAQGDRLFERVQQFDKLERGIQPVVQATSDGSIGDQLARLRTAFGRLAV